MCECFKTIILNKLIRQVLFLSILSSISCLKLIAQNTLDSYTIQINEVMASNDSTYFDNFDEADDWVELYNFGEVAVDLNGLYISDKLENIKKFQISSSFVLEPNEYRILWADGQTEQGENHLDFKLSQGDQLILSSEEGIIDRVTLELQRYGVSYGRLQDNEDVWKYFLESTPEVSNQKEGLDGILDKPISSKMSGGYDAPFDLLLSSEPGSEIRLTTDGTEPTLNSLLYRTPIRVSSELIVSTKVFKVNHVPSETCINTYLFDQNSSLPTLYLTSVFSDLRGDSDKKIHVSFVDEEGKELFSQSAGVQGHGDVNQNSFKLFFRSKYGDNKVENTLFQEKPDVDGFRRLIFRQAGNDGLNTKNTDRSHLRDGFISTIVNKGDFYFKAPGFRQVTVYFNGGNIGIFNMRERIDKHFIENNYDYDSDDEKSFIEYKFDVPGNVNVIEGNRDYFFKNVWEYARDNDLSIDENYIKIKNVINIEDFTDYWIHEVFVGNYDWLSNNMYFWSPINTSIAKFRWILWDTDIGLGFGDEFYSSPAWNTLDFSTGTEDIRTFSGSRTQIIRALLNNREYKTYFITRFCDLLNSEYLPSNTNSILTELVDKVRPEISNHTEFWGVNSFNNWSREINQIRDYVNKRPAYTREHLKEKFDLESKYDLTLNTSIEGAGTFTINTIDLEGLELPWEGGYFKGLPIAVTVKAVTGYRFIGWEGYSEDSTTINLIPDRSINLVALFEEINPSVGGIVINEISYAQKLNYNSRDWVELYNSTTETIDLSEWVLIDGSGNEGFSIPVGTSLNPDDYLVIARDLNMFNQVYLDVTNSIGDFTFGLNKEGDNINLFNASNELVDFVSYDDVSPWPNDLKTNSIALKNPSFNNILGTNWEESKSNGGTPGKINDVFITDLKDQTSFDFEIYPNPSEGRIQFTTPQGGVMIISNVNGKEVFSQDVNQYNNKIDLSNLERGLYICTVILDNGMRESKPIVMQ